MHLAETEESEQKLEEWIKEGLLMPAIFCNECLFYAHHDINNPEQENYNHDIHFKVEEYQNGTEMRWYGSPYNGIQMESPKWETRVIILGKKPKPNFPCIRGPFILVPIEE